jgi:hypothetical protein
MEEKREEEKKVNDEWERARGVWWRWWWTMATPTVIWAGM